MITCTEYIFTYLYIVYIVFILNFTSFINAALSIYVGRPLRFHRVCFSRTSSYVTMRYFFRFSVRLSVKRMHCDKNEIIICKFVNTITIELCF